jgi:FixJ family two-component response regulator
VTSADDATVFVIDDDARMRAATERLLRSVGLNVEAFATPKDFLTRELPDGPSCLVLDVRLPGMSGLDVQCKLTEAGADIPVIFITGHGDIPMTVKQQQREIRKLKERYQTLTARECEVMSLLVSGMLTKQIASRLGTSEITAQVHRGQVMHKMHANSPVELGRMAEKLKLPAAT